MKPFVVLVSILATALLASCDAVTGPGSSEGSEIRPALRSLTHRTTDRALGGGLILEGHVSEAEETPGLHDVIPVVVEAAAGDREQVRLRRLWGDDDRGLYQIFISLGPAANIASSDLPSRLREIGAVYSFHNHRFPREALYVTTVPYQWARVAVEEWPHVTGSFAPGVGGPDPLARHGLRVSGGLPATADPPAPGDGILQVQPGEVVMIEYVDDRGTVIALPPFNWRF